MRKELRNLEDSRRLSDGGFGMMGAQPDISGFERMKVALMVRTFWICLL
jgi:hypothetical protein